MNLTSEDKEAKEIKHPTRGRRRPLDRRVPGWASGLLGRLAQDSPDIIVRDDISTYLIELKSKRSVDRTVEELSRLGWLAALHVKGAWAYLPPGQEEVIDPYIDLRAWKARNAEAVFALAGEAAAWHLGYLDRAFDGRVSVWAPVGARLPYGLRPHVSLVTLGWQADQASRLGPTSRLLHERKLDMTRWADGLPSFGPEALIVQLSARPGSFRPWADLVSHLDALCADVDPDRLRELLEGKSASAWQRAAYILHSGSRIEEAERLMEGRPRATMAKAALGSGVTGVWIPEFQLVDRLIAPLRDALGKA